LEPEVLKRRNIVPDPREPDQRAFNKGETTMSATVLVADADPISGADWEALLLSQGYNVASARNGKAALAFCARLRPDLVLLNESLPDMPGLELCRRIKADLVNRLMPVIVLAAPANESDGWSQLETRVVDDFWVRPQTRLEALTRIHSLLQLKFYIDEQAESVICSLSYTIEAQNRFAMGHCTRVSHHHERIDGSGYPDGVSGEQIPLTVRVLQIVDICDALTNDRSYRLPLSLPRALIVMYEEAEGLAG
jgi:response regulator RpfG family c-di-GMP phosphodiesterase